MPKSEIGGAGEQQCRANRSSRRDFLKQVAMALSAANLAALPGCFTNGPSWSSVSEQIDNPHLQPNLSGESLDESLRVDAAASRVPRYFYVREGVRVAIVDVHGDGKSTYLRFTNRELNVIASALDNAPLEWLKRLRVIQSKEAGKDERRSGSTGIGQAGTMTLYIKQGGSLLASAKGAPLAEQPRTIGSHPEEFTPEKRDPTLQVTAGTPVSLYSTVLHELGHIWHYHLLVDRNQGAYWKTLHVLSGEDPDNYVSDYAATDSFEDFAETIESWTYDSQASIRDALMTLERGKPLRLLKALFVMSQAITDDRLHFYTPHPTEPASILETQQVTFDGNAVEAGQLVLGLNEQGLVISCHHGGQGAKLPFPGYFMDFAPRIPVSGSRDLIEIFENRPEVIQPMKGAWLSLVDSDYSSYVSVSNVGTERGGVRLSDPAFDRYMFLGLRLPTAQSEETLHFILRFLFKNGPAERAFEVLSAVDHPEPITLKYDLESEFNGSYGRGDLEALEISFDAGQTVFLTSAQSSPDPQLMLQSQLGETYYDRETNLSWFSSQVVEEYLPGILRR